MSSFSPSRVGNTNEIHQMTMYVGREVRAEAHKLQGESRHLQPMILGRSFPILVSVGLPLSPTGWQGGPSGGLYFLSPCAT